MSRGFGKIFQLGKSFLRDSQNSAVIPPDDPTGLRWGVIASLVLFAEQDSAVGGLHADEMACLHEPAA